ncbi:MAG: YdbL family protein [Syntrophales bacterium]|jgi:uncharacterized protein YdbL (DUF1318 family)|nr:YdbL family protein [Syntrophales bacterium]
MKTFAKFTGLFTLLFVTACVTVNIYFPSAEVQRAADIIVDDIRTKVNEARPEPKPSSRLDLRNLFGPANAHAATDIDVSTPAIRGIKDAIRNRFPQLKPFYDRGAVGESNRGFVAVTETGGLGLQERSLLNRLIDQENKDRAALYKEIAAANKLGPESVPQIEKIFANSWRDKSLSGWWVQNDDGVWEKK